MMPFTIAPAVPGTFVAMSNVLCTAYLPVASMVCGVVSLPLSLPPLSPPPSSSPGVPGWLEAQPVAATPRARIEAKPRFLKDVIGSLPVEDGCRPLVQRKCQWAHPRDPREIEELRIGRQVR